MTGKNRAEASSLLDRGLFDLGLQSRDLPLLQDTVRARLGIELDVLTIFDYPTVRKLADFLCTQSVD